MKKVISVLLVVIIALTLSVNAFAATVSRPVANATRDAAKVKFDAAVNRFDINGSAQIDAEDARLTLRYSAGIAEENLDAAKMDVDGDGMVTAIDARSILRLSAGLDKTDKYLTNAEKLEYFNAILNTAIPNNFDLYKNGIEHTRGITYTDPKGVVASIDDAFKKVDKTMSFEKLLLADAGQKEYYQHTYINNTSHAQSKMMQINNSSGVDENQSSYLTLDDISSVEYLQNQTYTFTRYKTDSNDQITSQVDYSQTVTGLDYLKVKIKSDNNVKGVHASKAFIVYDEKELEEEVKTVAELFNKMSTELPLGNEMSFSVTPGMGGVKYYNTEITIYYHPENGKIVAAYYSMYTDYTMILNMDVDIIIPFPYFIFIDVTGPVSITNTTQSIKEYYFIENNPNHIPW